jgi:hypothetical protein
MSEINIDSYTALIESPVNLPNIFEAFDMFLLQEYYIEKGVGFERMNNFIKERQKFETEKRKNVRGRSPKSKKHQNSGSS